MTKKRKYLYSDRDRHGNRRWYFQGPGQKKIRIREAEGTAEFYATYQRLFANWEAGEVPETTRLSKSSLEWLTRQYMSHSTFKALAPSTQSQRRNFYQRFCRVHGDAQYADLSTGDISATRDALAVDARFSARNFVKAMRALYAWASDPDADHGGYVDHNPALSVKLPSPKTEGHKRWTLDHVHKFKSHYPKGHRARIALACLLFTVQRISDVRLMGRKDVRDGLLRVRHHKTKNVVEIPILGLLRDELGAQYNEMLWWQNEYGAPYSAKSCSMRFSKYAADAGLPSGYTAHGLRKCVPTLLADLGFSEDTLMAILGDETADQARVYVQGANRRRLADQGLRAAEAGLAAAWNKSG